MLRPQQIHAHRILVQEESKVVRGGLHWNSHDVLLHDGLALTADRQQCGEFEEDRRPDLVPVHALRQFPVSLVPAPVLSPVPRVPSVGHDDGSVIRSGGPGARTFRRCARGGFAETCDGRVHGAVAEGDPCRLVTSHAGFLVAERFHGQHRHAPLHVRRVALVRPEPEVRENGARPMPVPADAFPAPQDDRPEERGEANRPETLLRKRRDRARRRLPCVQGR